jgi:hypothetical protein
VIAVNIGPPLGVGSAIANLPDILNAQKIEDPSYCFLRFLDQNFIKDDMRLPCWQLTQRC